MESNNFAALFAILMLIAGMVLFASPAGAEDIGIAVKLIANSSETVSLSDADLAFGLSIARELVRDGVDQGQALRIAFAATKLLAYERTAIVTAAKGLPRAEANEFMLRAASSARAHALLFVETAIRELKK